MTRLSRLMIFGAVAAMAPATHALAQGIPAAPAWPDSTPASPTTVADPAATLPEPAPTLDLRPNRFVWTPQASTSGPVEIVVSLTLQVAYVYRGGILIGAASVSSGAPGHDTPTGTFPILQKRQRHFSNLYDNAPMPFMQRLTWDGIALHAGSNPGHPDSHGCIRLPMAFARSLFAVTSIGSLVHVTDEAPTAREAALMLRRPAEGATMAASD